MTVISHVCTQCSLLTGELMAISINWTGPIIGKWINLTPRFAYKNRHDKQSSIHILLTDTTTRSLSSKATYTCLLSLNWLLRKCLKCFKTTALFFEALYVRYDIETIFFEILLDSFDNVPLINFFSHLCLTSAALKTEVAKHNYFLLISVLVCFKFAFFCAERIQVYIIKLMFKKCFQ